jgi:hypothetical protein
MYDITIVASNHMVKGQSYCYNAITDHTVKFSDIVGQQQHPATATGY